MIDKKLKYYAKKLNEDAPKGEFLAYINKKESNLLKRKGGLGIKTKSGIPSYIGSDASGQGGGSSGGGPGDASDSGSGGNGGNGGDGGDRHNPNTPSGYSPVSVRSTPKTPDKTPTGPNQPDDPNATPKEYIGGKKFDVTPETRVERNQAKVKQSILDAPIPNFTPKGIEYFKDGKLLTNSLVPGDDPLGKPKFNLLNTVGNVLGYAYGGPLFAKYKQAQALYKGAKLATDVLSDITGKNVSKPFQTIENLTKNIGLKDKNVIESFKDSLTNNLTSKTRTKNKPESVINIDTKNNNEGINTLENVNALQDEYKTLLQKLQTGIITDEEQVRYNMLKNMLGI